MRRWIYLFRKNQEGAAAVEMGLCTAFLFFIVPTGIDLATVIDTTMQMSAGLRAGVHAALDDYTNTSRITSVVQNASGLTSATVPTPTTACYCDSTSATCGTACSDGTTAARLMTITASYSQATFFDYGIVPNPMTISRSVTVRVE